MEVVSCRCNLLHLREGNQFLKPTCVDGNCCNKNKQL